MRFQGVLDGELVQPELSGQLVQLFPRGTREVDPHDRVGIPQVLRDIGDGEALGLEDPLPIDPRHGFAHSSLLSLVARQRSPPADYPTTTGGPGGRTMDRSIHGGGERDVTSPGRIGRGDGAGVFDRGRDARVGR